MNRQPEIVTTGLGSIETYLDGDGDGPDIVILPSYGRDGGADFDSFTAALSGWYPQTLRMQHAAVTAAAGASDPASRRP
jgi:hypothetical protein